MNYCSCNKGDFPSFDFAQDKRGATLLAPTKVEGVSFTDAKLVISYLCYGRSRTHTYA